MQSITSWVYGDVPRMVTGVDASFDIQAQGTLRNGYMAKAYTAFS